jgi:hypothetical protein
MGKKHLSLSLHRNKACCSILALISIVSSLLTADQSTTVPVDGRLIFSLAQNALKHGKKALSIERAALCEWEVSFRVE